MKRINNRMDEFNELVEDTQGRKEYINELETDNMILIMEAINKNFDEFNSNYKSLDIREFIYELIANDKDITEGLEPPAKQVAPLQPANESLWVPEYYIEDMKNENKTYNDLSEDQINSILREYQVIECIAEDILKDTGRLYSSLLYYYTNEKISKWDACSRFDDIMEHIKKDKRFI